MKKSIRRQNTILALVVLLLFITIAYATLSTNLTINGTSKINNSTWNVHFNTPVPTEGSVAIDTTTYASAKAATKDSATQVSYNVLLTNPGDYYEFTVPVQNEGTIDAMIDTITSTIQIGTGTVQNITSSTLPSWLSYSVTYFDDAELAINQLVASGTTETYKVRVEFKRDIDEIQLEDAAGKELKLTFSVNYIQADDHAIKAVADPVSFSTDSWQTIRRAVLTGNTSNYSLGQTKNIDMGDFGTHIIRIANKSTPSDCSNQDFSETTGFSQTACGFVLEFADIITTHRMNPMDWTKNGIGNGNEGGWEYTEMRFFLNNDIYNSLPVDLRKAIIDTRVISGHGSIETDNITTIDKLYLISGIEYINSSYYDSLTSSQTRQLDYYSSNEITSASNDLAKKEYNSSYKDWWLRSPKSINRDAFTFVSYLHNDFFIQAGDSGGNKGVSPAFRIA